MSTPLRTQTQLSTHFVVDLSYNKSTTNRSNGVCANCMSELWVYSQAAERVEYHFEWWLLGTEVTNILLELVQLLNKIILAVHCRHTVVTWPRNIIVNSWMEYDDWRLSLCCVHAMVLPSKLTTFRKLQSGKCPEKCQFCQTSLVFDHATFLEKSATPNGLSSADVPFRNLLRTYSHHSCCISVFERRSHTGFLANAQHKVTMKWKNCIDTKRRQRYRAVISDAWIRLSYSITFPYVFESRHRSIRETENIVSSIRVTW